MLQWWTLALLAISGAELQKVWGIAGPGFKIDLTCSSQDNYFDISALECRACAQQKIARPDGLGCACRPGYVPAAKVASESSSECISCLATNQAVSSDGRVCVSCDAATNATLDTKTGRCTCASTNRALVEFDATGARLAAAKCQRCGNGSYVSPLDFATCQPCPSPKVYSKSTQTCVCPSGGQSTTACVQDDTAAISALAQTLGTSLQSPYTVRYYDVQVPGGGRTDRTVDSAIFRQLFLSSVKACTEREEREACNALANLCVLQLYSKDSAACKAHLALQSRRQQSLTHGVDGWSVSLPWLYYEGGARGWLTRTDIQSRVAFSPTPGAMSEVAIVFSAYSLNGTWLGLHNLTSQLQICGARAGEAMEWRRFGTNFINKCTLSLDLALSLPEAQEPIFYDAYLQDGEDVIYPVPVRLLNYRDISGQLVNNKQGTFGDFSAVLTRRFFVADFASARTNGATPATAEPAGADGEAAEAGLPAVRFPEKIQLTIMLQSGTRARIYPPTLTIKYKTYSLEFTRAVSAKASFEVEYTMDMGSFWNAWMIVLIVANIIAFFLWCLRMHCFVRRRQNQNFDMEFLFRAVVEACVVIARLFFLMCFCAGLYWLVFFKMQGHVYAMMPRDGSIASFRIVLVIALIAQLVAVGDMVWSQSNVDIFFIDWEKSRQTLAPGGAKELAPVSVWRTLFIANEWNELQCVRQSCLELTLVLVLLFLEGLRLSSLSSIRPRMKVHTPTVHEETSIILRFAVASFTWLAITSTQVLMRRVVGHRYVEHPLTQFVDLLSLANVSVLILHTKFAGYYLHGRSVYTSADTSMAELNAELRKEMEGLVSARGLVSGSNMNPKLADNQIFEIFITTELRSKYDAKLMRRIEEERQRKHRQRGGYVPKSLQAPHVPQEATVRAQEEVASLFRHFINQLEADVSRRVLEKGFLQRLLNVPPDMTNTRSPIFFHDFQNLFGSVIFYGVEADLTLLEILIYSSIDMATKNIAVSLFLTYLLSRTISLVRHTLGEANISRKSLVDSRFLL